MTSQGFLKGHQWQPRDIAAVCYDEGFTDAVELVTAVAINLAESQGYDHAYNDNFDASGKLLSRDVGIMEINIPASQVGTAKELELYDVPTCIGRGRVLFEARGFQPWASFNSTIYLHDTYLKRAAKGVGNFLGETLLARAVAAHADGTPYEHTLTNPVLDYEYRTVGLLGSIAQALAQISKAQHDRSLAEVSTAVATLKNGRLIAKN